MSASSDDERTNTAPSNRLAWWLADVSWVSLRGADVRRFANGMFTNNVRDLPVGGVQRTSMLDDRGRLVGQADLWLARDDFAYLLLEGISAASFNERYQTFIVFDEVEVEVDDAVVAAHVTGVVPSNPATGAVVDGVTCWARCRGPSLGLDIVGPRASVIAHAAELGATWVDDAVGELARVRAGLARWPTDAAFRKLPHELGLREHTLHFVKGCYVGQEVVNRIDVMGEVKRALVVVAGQGAPPDHGAAVAADGAVVGQLTSVVGHSDAWCALCAVRRPFDAVGTALTVDGGGAAVVQAAERALG